MTTAKKTTKKVGKKVGAFSRQAAAAAPADTVRDLTKMLNGALDPLVAKLPETPDETLSQEAIVTAAYLDKLIAAAKGARDEIKARALTVRGHGGYEKEALPGHELAVVVWTPGTPRRTPKWQEIATEEARLRAKEAGEEFDAEQFVEAHKTATTPSNPSDSASFHIVE